MRFMFTAFLIRVSSFRAAFISTLLSTFLLMSLLFISSLPNTIASTSLLPNLCHAYFIHSDLQKILENEVELETVVQAADILASLLHQPHEISRDAKNSINTDLNNLQKSKGWDALQKKQFQLLFQQLLRFQEFTKLQAAKEKLQQQRLQNDLLKTQQHDFGVQVKLLSILDHYGTPSIDLAFYHSAKTAGENTKKLNTTEMEFLLQQGANINLEIGETTALYTAAQEGKENLVRFLLKNGANANPSVGFTTPLMAASIRGSLKTARMLLEAGAQVDAQNAHGLTALMLVLDNIFTSKDYSEKLEIFKLLLSKKANIHLQSKNGGTVFLHSIQSKSAMELLLKAGANIDEQDNAGYTALMLASINTYGLETVEYLLQNGANTELRDVMERQTALELAKNRGSRRVIEILENYKKTRTAP